MHVKKGDTVEVIAGESKGQQGKVIKVYPEQNKVIVEGEGMKKYSKHTKPNAANPQGGIVQQDAPIHISNVMVVDPSTGEATRIGRKKDEQGKSIRYSKKSGEEIK